MAVTEITPELIEKLLGQPMPAYQVEIVDRLLKTKRIVMVPVKNHGRRWLNDILREYEGYGFSIGHVLPIDKEAPYAG